MGGEGVRGGGTISGGRRSERRGRGEGVRR